MKLIDNIKKRKIRNDNIKNPLYFPKTFEDDEVLLGEEHFYKSKIDNIFALCRLYKNLEYNGKQLIPDYNFYSEIVSGEYISESDQKIHVPDWGHLIFFTFIIDKGDLYDFPAIKIRTHYRKDVYQEIMGGWVDRYEEITKLYGYEYITTTKIVNRNNRSGKEILILFNKYILKYLHIMEDWIKDGEVKPWNKIRGSL